MLQNSASPHSQREFTLALKFPPYQSVPPLKCSFISPQPLPELENCQKHGRANPKEEGKDTRIKNKIKINKKTQHNNAFPPSAPTPHDHALWGQPITEGGRTWCRGAD